MKNIVIFASGTGSNALKIISHFENNDLAKIALIVSNNPQAGVLLHAKRYNIPTLIIDRAFFYKTEKILEKFSVLSVDLIVLAGFLWLIPSYLVKAYPEGIINIHPALLPKYGGKGMYGMHVHKAVWEAKEKESGISIHYVNEKYDEGALIFQAKCTILPYDLPKTIAKKVLQLEHQYFSMVIEKLVKSD